jgi:hypothetical protein
MTQGHANYQPPSCPRCRSSVGFHPIEIQEDSGTGCLMFVLGGFIPYLLYDSSRRGRVQCEGCGFVFRPPQRLTRWDFALVFFIVAAILAAVVYVLFASVSR